MFTGEIEALSDELNTYTADQAEVSTEEYNQITEVELKDIIDTVDDSKYEDNISIDRDSSVNTSEPFEYFIDFDDPIGEPLTDEDLYIN